MQPSSVPKVTHTKLKKITENIIVIVRGTHLILSVNTLLISSLKGNKMARKKLAKRTASKSKGKTFDTSSQAFKWVVCTIDGCIEEVKIDFASISAICYKHTMGRVPFIEPASRKKKSTGRPRGWQFMNEFVDSDKTVFHRGVEQPELKGTLPVSDVVKIKADQKQSAKEKKARKTDRLIKRHEKAQEARRKDAGKAKPGRPKTKKKAVKKTVKVQTKFGDLKIPYKLKNKKYFVASDNNRAWGKFDTMAEARKAKTKFNREHGKDNVKGIVLVSKDGRAWK